MNWRNFNRCNTFSPYARTTHGVGYIGEGIYRNTDGNGVNTKTYRHWFNMIDRCYCEEYKEKHPTYKDCIVCEEWHNFQNFAKWYDENYYEVKGEIMDLDKDLLVDGNKIYSPSTCTFIPQIINKILYKSENKYGLYPVGVNKTRSGKYVARYSNRGKRVRVGLYDTPEEAFRNYKIHKEDYVKSVANQYKNVIPNAVYKVLMDYEVK